MGVPRSHETAVPQPNNEAIEAEAGSPAFSRGDLLAALATALFVLAVYVLQLPVKITGEDAGELAAAAYVLGIPHPPGYPLWCLLAHVFTWIPLYTVAWRVALFSAVMGAGTVCLMVLLCKRLSGSMLASVVASLALAFSFDFLGQSIIPEVYTLNTFLLAASWLLLALWYENRADRFLWAIAVVQGLNFANHNTSIAVAPFFALFVLLVEWRGCANLRSFLVARLPFYAMLSLLSVLIAIALYCYLPIRSLANPPIDWGNPETLANWWRHFTRAQYEFMVWENLRSVGRFIKQLQWQGGFWIAQYYLVIPVLGVMGHLFIQRGRRAVAGLILLSGVYTFLVFLIIQNPSQDKEWLFVMRVFSLPLSLSAALGATLLISRASRRPKILYLLLIAASILPMAYLQLNVRAAHGQSAVEDYARKLLSVLPENAIYVPSADHQSFPLQYLQVVEGVRPDVTLARKYGYLDMSLFPPEFVDKYSSFPARRHEPELISWLLTLDTRPIYFSKRPSLKDADVHFESCWLLERAMREREVTAESWSEASCALRPEDPLFLQARSEARSGDYTASVIAMEWCFKSAAWCFEAGQEGALAWLDRGIGIYGRATTSLYNAGAIAARYGDYASARRYFEEALALDPTHQPSMDALKRLADK
jgi:tetratricopeptide (TPR) repeat protein